MVCKYIGLLKTIKISAHIILHRCTIINLFNNSIIKSTKKNKKKLQNIENYTHFI